MYLAVVARAIDLGLSVRLSDVEHTIVPARRAPLPPTTTTGPSTPTTPATCRAERRAIRCREHLRKRGRTQARVTRRAQLERLARSPHRIARGNASVRLSRVILYSRAGWV